MTTILEATPQIRVEEIHFPTNKISSLQEFASRISTWLAQSIEVIFSPVSALVATIDCLSNNTYALKASVNYNLKVTAKISLLVYSIFSFKTEKTALLQRAMEKEHYDIARYMLYKGVSPFGKNPENSPLVIAAEKGHVDLIKSILDKAKNHPSQDDRQQVEKAALETVIHKITQGKGSWEIFHLLIQASLKEANEPVESLFRTHILPIETLEIRNYMAMVFFTNSPSAKIVFLKNVIENIDTQKNETLVKLFIKEGALKPQNNSQHLLQDLFNSVLKIQDEVNRYQILEYLFENKLPLQTAFINGAIREEDLGMVKRILEQNSNQSKLDYSRFVNPLTVIEPKAVRYAIFETLFQYCQGFFGVDQIFETGDVPGFIIAFNCIKKTPKKFRFTPEKLVVLALCQMRGWLQEKVNSMLNYALSTGFKPSQSLITQIIKKEDIRFILTLLKNVTSPESLQKQLEASKPTVIRTLAESNLAGSIIRANTIILRYTCWKNAIWGLNKYTPQDPDDDYTPPPPKINDDYDKLAIKTIIEREMLGEDEKSYNRLVTFFNKNPQVIFTSTIGIRLAIQKQDLEPLKLFINRTDLKNLIATSDAFLPLDDHVSMLIQFAEDGGIERTYLTTEEFEKEYNRRFPNNSYAYQKHMDIIDELERAKKRINDELEREKKEAERIKIEKNEMEENKLMQEDLLCQLEDRITELNGINLEDLDDRPQKMLAIAIRQSSNKNAVTIFQLAKQHLLKDPLNNNNNKTVFTRLKGTTFPASTVLDPAYKPLYFALFNIILTLAQLSNINTKSPSCLPFKDLPDEKLQNHQRKRLIITYPR